MQTDHTLLGEWNGSAYPTQDTTLVFCVDGRGLLFYYHGSEEGSPFLDEFSWSVIRDGVLQVKWQLLHTEDCESDADDDGTDVPPLIVMSGTSEEIGYSFIDGRLDISLGLQDGYFTKLSRVGSAADYDAEHRKLTELAANFDPFGPDRTVWDVSTPGEWRKVPLETLASRAKHGPIPLFTLGLIFGLLGQVAYLADYGRDIMPTFVRLALHFVPALLILFSADDEDCSTGFGRFVTRVRTFASAWYLLITGIVAVAAVSGYRPTGWWMYLLFIAAGTWSCASVIRRR